MLAALTQFQNVGVNPLSRVVCRTSPDQGRYLKASEPVPEVRVFLQRRVYVFRLRKPTASEPVCDWLLTAEIHHLNSEKLETEKLELLIWVFWYCPTQAAIALSREIFTEFVISPAGVTALSASTGCRNRYFIHQ